MKLIRPPLIQEYGKYFKSDEIFINKLTKVLTQQGTLYYLPRLLLSRKGLDKFFCWKETKEGHSYWAHIYNHIATPKR